MPDRLFQNLGAAWREVETASQFRRLEQTDGPYAVEGDILDASGTTWVWCVVEGPPNLPRVTSDFFHECELAMREAERMARLRGHRRSTGFLAVAARTVRR